MNKTSRKDVKPHIGNPSNDQSRVLNLLTESNISAFWP